MIDFLRPKIAEPTPEIRVGERTLPITVKRHPTAKRLILRVARDGESVQVTMPRWGRSGDAFDFVRSRQSWIERQLAKIGDCDGEAVPFYRGAQLIVDWREDLPRRPTFTGDTLFLGGPREQVSSRITRWLEGEALRLFESDCTYYCDRAGLPSAPVRLSRAGRRWGSCSSSGTLRINWRLIQAPDFVRRSVVAHEVAHLVHFDHSPAFHALLGRLYGSDIARADAWLKARGPSLYAIDRLVAA